MVAVDIYGGRSPVAIPLYTYADASRYLKLPPSTVRYWSIGGPVTARGKRIDFRPVLNAPEGGLTFENLVELHVLKALRKTHKVRLEAIRKAMDYASTELGVDRLLLADLQTYGPHVLIKHFEDLVALDQGGQLMLEDLVQRYLDRVKRDNHGVPIKLYPVVADSLTAQPVSINPFVSFGKPTVADTGIATWVIADRIAAGETFEAVAQDYGLELDLVRDAVLYEMAA